jgi:hypothetical protein
MAEISTARPTFGDPMTRTTNVSRTQLVTGALTLLVVAALAVSAYVHLDLASLYSHNKSSGTISQGFVFRVQAVASIIVAVALVLFGRKVPLLFALAGLLMLASVGAVVLYRYVDVGKLLFLPDMYEPLWFGEKTLSAFIEGAGAIVGLAAVPFLWRDRGTRQVRSAGERRRATRASAASDTSS